MASSLLSLRCNPLAATRSASRTTCRRVTCPAFVARQGLVGTGSRNVAARAYGQRDPTPAEKTEEKTDEILDKAQEYLETVQEKWEETDDKPAVIAIVIVAFVAVWATSGLIDRIDRLPVVGGVLELVGLLVTGWFVYRYLIFGPDREELKSNLQAFYKKVTGER